MSVVHLLLHLDAECVVKSGVCVGGVWSVMGSGQDKCCRVGWVGKARGLGVHCGLVSLCGGVGGLVLVHVG